MKLTKTKLSFFNRKLKAEEDLINFREKSLKEMENNKQPIIAEIGMEMYESLLQVDFGIKNKPKLIGELFGIKIMIDPMLKLNEIRWKYN
jgi:hypothetical protein